MPATHQESVSLPHAIVILGATSDLGSRITTLLANDHHIVLASRRPADLQPLVQQLYAAGAKSVDVPYFDATDFHATRKLLTPVFAQYTVKHLLVCFGILGDQHRGEHDEHHAAEIATIDYTSQIVALTVAADCLLAQNTPATLTAFSSIAGWRARKANYIYGSTKAGLDAFCQGLTDRLHHSPVALLVARPGFIIGSMTQGMSPAPLSLPAATVATIVAKQLGTLEQSKTLWIPRKLVLLAWVMKLLPRAVWRRMPR